MTSDQNPPAPAGCRYDADAAEDAMWREAEVDAAASPPADRTALRDRVAEALYRHSHPGWAMRYADLDRDERDTYLGRADAVLAVLPEPTNRPGSERAVRQIGQMVDFWERHLPDVIRTPAVVAAIRSALEPSDSALPEPADRGAVLDEAADAIDRETQALKDAEVLERGKFRPCRDASAQLRRMAAEARVSPASTAPLAASLQLVKGHCPACGWETLFLGAGGYVTCSRIDCPEPDAAGTLLERLAAEETHVVADGSDDPEHVDDCPGCETAEARATDTQDSEAGALTRAHVALAEQAGQDRAAVARVRRLHDNLAAETNLASPDDSITRGAAARRIATALDGWNPTGAPSCDVGFEGGGRCAKPAGHRPPGSDDPHVRVVVVHACPPVGSSLTPCCGRTPFELPLGDRIGSEAPTTCKGAPRG